MSTPNTVYRGERLIGPGMTAVGVRVTVDGRPLTLPPSLRAYRGGFEWGYLGAGPASLALAVVFDATGDREYASRAYQWFMRAVVLTWVNDSWRITAGEVLAQLDRWDREEAQRARMRDPGYVPTVEEALADPNGFVEGMTETEGGAP